MQSEIKLISAIISAAVMGTLSVSAKPPLPPQPAKHPPVPVTVMPPPPPPAVRHTAVYTPQRNTYTIQLGHRNSLLFEQRIVGMQELRDKVRMVSNDRPKPMIVIRVVDGVNDSRVNHAVKLLREHGFKEIKIERLGRRVKTIPHRKAPARLKR